MKKTRAKRPAGAHVILYRLLKTYEKPSEKTNDTKTESVRAILLTKRTLDVSVHPGCWSLIGGNKNIKKDKTSKETAQRELVEELEVRNIDLRNYGMKKVRDVKIVRESGKHTICYFSALLQVAMDDLRLLRNKCNNKVESEGLGWFTAEEIHHLNVRPEDRTAINHFFEQNGC